MCDPGENALQLHGSFNKNRKKHHCAHSIPFLPVFLKGLPNLMFAMHPEAGHRFHQCASINGSKGQLLSAPPAAAATAWRLRVACCWERTALLEHGGAGSSSESTSVHCRQYTNTALCNLKSNIRLQGCYIFNKSLGKCRNPIKAAALWLLGNFLLRSRAEGMSYIENKIWHFLCLTANCG